MRVLALTRNASLVVALEAMMRDWEVVTVGDVDEASAAGSASEVALIDLGDTAVGLEASDELYRRGVAIPCVVIGDLPDESGRAPVLIRPFTLEELSTVVLHASESPARPGRREPPGAALGRGADLVEPSIVTRRGPELIEPPPPAEPEPVVPPPVEPELVEPVLVGPVEPELVEPVLVGPVEPELVEPVLVGPVEPELMDPDVLTGIGAHGRRTPAPEPLKPEIREPVPREPEPKAPPPARQAEPPVPQAPPPAREPVREAPPPAKIAPSAPAAQAPPAAAAAPAPAPAVVPPPVVAEPPPVAPAVATPPVAPQTPPAPKVRPQAPSVPVSPRPTPSSPVPQAPSPRGPSVAPTSKPVPAPAPEAPAPVRAEPAQPAAASRWKLRRKQAPAPSTTDTPLLQRLKIAAAQARALEVLLEEMPFLAKLGLIAEGLAGDLQSQFNAEIAAVYLQRDNGYQVIAHRGLSQAEASVVVAETQPIFSDVMMTGEGILVQPVKLAAPLVAGIGGARTEALMVVPAAVDNQLIAMLVVGGFRFDENDLNRLGDLATEAAPGIAVARLLERLGGQA